MNANPIKHEVTVNFSENEFLTLNYIAGKFDMSAQEVIRCLIPKIPVVKASSGVPVQSYERIFQEEGPYKIVDNFDRSRLLEICNELINERKAKKLGDEIKEQLLENTHKRDILTMTTEKRVIRWAHPARIDNRTRFATPRAKEICMILFGFIPDRED